MDPTQSFLPVSAQAVPGNEVKTAERGTECTSCEIPHNGQHLSTQQRDDSV